MARLLPRLSAAAALLAALPAAGETVEFDWRGVGQGAVVRSGDGHDLFGAYAVTGEGTLTTDSGLGLSLTATLGSGDYQKSLDRPGRKVIKKKENLLTAIFIAIGLLSLLRYYFLPLK